LLSYRTALKLILARGDHSEEGISICASLRNNVGVMSHRIGHTADALKVFAEVVGDGSDPHACVRASVTTTFNLARLHEDMSRPDLARPL
jgi:hypothetical protein